MLRVYEVGDARTSGSSEADERARAGAGRLTADEGHLTGAHGGLVAIDALDEATLAGTTKLRGTVELVGPGSWPNDGKIIADERPGR